MKDQTYYLGIDLGTSAAKAVLRNSAGENRKAKCPYTANTPDGWMAAVEALIRELKIQTEGRIAAVGFSSQVGTYIIDGSEVISWQSDAGLAELEEICALPGIDMIFFGPADFSQGIGVPNDFSNEKVLETRRLVAETARKHGKFAGTVGGMKNQDILIELGYQFINLGSDVRALASYFSEITAACTDKTARKMP